ncbi:hypothetical protein JCM1840_003416 [Sporobolomyces johnsonii]
MAGCPGPAYLFTLDEDHAVDSDLTGNHTRFINHSIKRANCVAAGDRPFPLYAASMSKTSVNRGKETYLLVMAIQVIEKATESPVYTVTSNGDPTRWQTFICLALSENLETQHTQLYQKLEGVPYIDMRCGTGGLVITLDW